MRQSEKSLSSESNSSSKKIIANINKQKALELRMSGKTFEQIGDELGLSRQYAWRIVTEELRKMNEERVETRESLRQLMNHRYEKIMSKLWKQSGIGSDSDDSDLDIGLLDRLMRVIEAQIKLNGLDAITDSQEAQMALQAGGSRLAMLVLQYLPEEKRDDFMKHVKSMVVEKRDTKKLEDMVE